MFKPGLIRVAAASPKLKVANTEYNVDEIIRCAKVADSRGAGVILFPELAITGYTCGDLFYQDFLYQKNLEGLKRIREASRTIKAAIVTGFYLKIENNHYNCAALIQGGSIMGVVPKMFLPNDREFYESRWFASGILLSRSVDFVSLLGEEVPFGHIIFEDEENGIKLGIEICQDLWVPVTPGSQLALNGAQILLNPSASSETVGKSQYRKNLVLQSSASNICGYVYVSSGVHESTTDLVFGGDSIIAENGALLTQRPLFERESAILYGEIDYQRIQFERTYSQNFEQCTSAFSNREYYKTACISPLPVIDGDKDTLIRTYSKNPFIPADPATSHQRFSEIFSIQTAGLAKRIQHTSAKKAVIGISGGLDSTLALLVTAETFRLLKRDPKDIIAVTMPGFGTTGKTYNNAVTIMKLLGADVREISIRESVLQHFKDIGHDETVHDVTYENSQARERTQILMDIANMEGGLVVGTGDLSEAALGWCTYNGDHMSMYGVNSGVPKTLVQHVIRWIMDNKLDASSGSAASSFSKNDLLLRQTLQDIMDTPISPELLPPDENGEIAQKTEDSVGPYILHDFFLYYTVRLGMEPKKLLYIAQTAFEDQYDAEFIRKWLITFYRRFFSQQFKRSCMPDGPKVGSVSLSPRGDWRMPSDGDASVWIKEIEK